MHSWVPIGGLHWDGKIPFLETTDDLAEATHTSGIRQRVRSLLAAIAPTLASVVLAAVVAAIVVVAMITGVCRFPLLEMFMHRA